MKSYIKLVNFEINRFAKLYGMLLLLIFLVQTGTTIIISKLYMHRIIDMVKTGSVELEYSKFNMFNVLYSLGFTAPIMIGVVALLFYMFFIWYRDWFARNAFIYRLLTLPTARMTVFFAKMTTIFLATLGLVTYQLTLLKFFTVLIKWLVPLTYREDLSVLNIVSASNYFTVLIPNTVAWFFIAYGAGIAFIIVIFTMILFERSYRLKGIAIGVLYLGFCMFLMLLPVIVQLMIGKFLLYPSELFMIELFMLLLITGLSLWTSRHLLKYKVTV